MGLIAYTSQTYDALLEKWLDRILEEQRILGPHESRIVVPNHRVANWLNRSMASRLGISMNLRFVYFESLLTQWVQQTQQQSKTKTEPRELSLEWTGILWDGMRSGHFDKAVAQSESSLRPGANSDLQTMQLAWEYAGILQLYGQHRPQWLLAWERGQDPSLPEASRQHAQLQKELYRFLLEKGATPHPLTRISNNDHQYLETTDEPTPLHCFGFWGFPPSKWRVIEHMSRMFPIFLYLPFPTEGYLADLTRKNLQQPMLLGEDGLRMGPNYQLLSKLGQRGRALQILLLDETVDTEECFEEQTRKLEKPNRLQLLQAQISNPDTFEPPILKVPAKQDASIQVHSVCNRRREVEVVKTIIQNALHQLPGLTLESIHVHAPDIAPYAPLIPEVFSTDASEHTIAFSIQNAVEGDSVAGIKVIMDLFRLLQSDWTISEVMQWISSEPVRQAMEFSLVDIELIQRWTEAAGIFRGNPGVPSATTEVHSWESGFERLMQAYAGALSSNALGKSSFDLDSPSDHTDTFCKFCTCYDLLKQSAILLLSRSHTLERYRFHLSWLMAKLIPSGYEFEKQVMLSVCNRLVTHLPVGLEMDLGGFVYLFRKTLPKLPPPQALSRKSGVQFASIQFEEMVPCRVRIVMGMNEGEFPSVEVSRSHNLLQTTGESEPGDPSRKEDQRYWLLQSIQQTADCWIATYQGQDATGNASRLLSPSVESILQSVNRMMDPEYFGKYRQPALHVTPIQHTRFAYDLRNFSTNPVYPHFSQTDFRIACHLTFGTPNHRVTFDPSSPGGIRSSTPVTSISIWELAAFFSHPNKYVCEQQLGIRFPDTHDFSPEHEPLFWAGMQASYSLRTDILRVELNHLGSSAIKDVIETHHALLPGYLKDIGIEWACGEIESIASLKKTDAWVHQLQLLEKTDLVHQTTAFDDGVELLHAAFENSLPETIQLGTIRASTLSAKHKLEAWVHLLALWMGQEAKVRQPFTLITKDKLFRLEPPEDPYTLLQSLIHLFLQYSTRPVPFFPTTSEALAKTPGSLNTMEHSHLWEGDRGEKLDPYNEYMFRLESPFTADCETLARQIYEPLFAHASTGIRKGGKA